MTTEYSIKPDERADRGSLDKRFDDIALRLRGLEAGRDAIKHLEADLIKLALERINQVLGPAYEEIEGKAHLGALLASTAEKEIALPFTGQNDFLVAEVDRNTFSPAGFLSFVSTSSPSAIMLGTFVSYDPDTGVLVATITNSTDGPAGPHTTWAVAIAQPPEIGYSYSQAEVDALIAAAIAGVVNDAGVDLDTLGEAEDRIIALEEGKAALSSPALVTPAIWQADNTATLQDAIEFVRGTGAGKRFKLKTLGDAANGIVGLAIVDVTTGDKLMEIGADGYVNALAGFKANGLAIPRILSVDQINPTFSATRTARSWAYYRIFGTIPILSASASLVINAACEMIMGDSTSNIASGSTGIAYYNGATDVALKSILLGLNIQNVSNNINYNRHCWAVQATADAAMGNGADAWQLALGTFCATSGIDVSWIDPSLTCWQIEAGDLGNGGL